MLLDDFGANITDGYIENNSQYAAMYKEVVRKNITIGNGYVSLERLVYFYLENEKLTFDELYIDNLDNELKQIKPISDVCENTKYKNYSVCNKDYIEESSQINDIQIKPFNSPLKFNNLVVTSYFKEERIIYDNSDIHNAWDFTSPEQTPIYSVCDGKVIELKFNYKENVIDVNGGAGNYIKIECNIDDSKYHVLYGHLYPNSTNLKIGDSVKHWEQIASMGTTGYSTGNHLHFEVTKNGKLVDGLSLIDFNNLNYG